jgi:hypothetical protein
VTRPVTHVAELAVKYASRNFVGVPLALDIGRLSRMPPANMTRKKLKAIRKLGLSFIWAIIPLYTEAFQRPWRLQYARAVTELPDTAKIASATIPGFRNFLYDMPSTSSSIHSI